MMNKMINQFQLQPVQQKNPSKSKKENPFLDNTKNNQDLSKFFGPVESKVTKKMKKAKKFSNKINTIDYMNQPQNMNKCRNEGFDFIEDFSSSEYESVSESDIP